MDLATFRSQVRLWLAAQRSQLDQFSVLPNDLDGQFAALREFQRILYDARWLRYGWPESIGGLGGPATLRGVLSEEISAAGYPPPSSFAMMEVLGPAVGRFAPEIARWALPALLRGEESWCQGFSEPDAGSDLASLRLRAVDEGDCWRVSGQKVWTSWAQYADRCVLLTRTGTDEEAHRGLTALFVDMNSAGVSIRPLRAMHGDAEFAEIFFDDVAVPKSRTIGRPGEGWGVAMYVLSCERGAVAWQRQAWMQRLLGELIGEADGRATPAWAGEAFALLYALRLVSRRTLRRLADGDTPGPDASVDKVLMASAEQLLFDGALEFLPATLVGTDDQRADRWRTDYLYSRAATIYGGTAEIQRNILAQRILRLPKG